jgi:hypothetical protein
MFNTFIINYLFFAEPLKVVRKTPVFRGTQFEYHCPSFLSLLRHFRRNAAAICRALIDFKPNIYIHLIPNGTLKVSFE